MAIRNVEARARGWHGPRVGDQLGSRIASETSKPSGIVARLLLVEVRNDDGHWTGYRTEWPRPKPPVSAELGAWITRNMGGGAR